MQQGITLHYISYWRSDVEIIGLALEALVNIMATEDIQNATPQEEELALQFAEIFLKNTENVSTLLALLEVLQLKKL